ncbi:MAG: phosphoribosyltransferase [Acidimicrobiia bacterium]
MYTDRVHGGRRLAEVLAGETVDVVLGVPRGGVIVAAEVSRACEAVLDVAVGRKIAAPHSPELAIGAAAAGGVRFIDEERCRLLAIPLEWIEAETARAAAEVTRREQAYRGGRQAADLTGRSVAVVDDGAATGATLVAVLRSVGIQRPDRLLCAVPVASRDAMHLLEPEADRVVSPCVPRRFYAVGQWYEDFRQTTDDEVLASLGVGE